MKSSCGCQTCDKRSLSQEFVHRSIDRLGTGKEFNRIGTLIKCASNLFYFKTSHLVHFAYLALWIIYTYSSNSESIRFEPWQHQLFICLFFSFFFKFQFIKLFFKGFAEYVQSKCTCVNVWWLSCYVQIENNVKTKRWDPEKILLNPKKGNTNPNKPD